jgi:hypothetical protein
VAWPRSLLLTAGPTFTWLISEMLWLSVGQTWPGVLDGAALMSLPPPVKGHMDLVLQGCLDFMPFVQPRSSVDMSGFISSSFLTC